MYICVATDAASPCSFDEGSPMIQDQTDIGYELLAIGIVSSFGTACNSSAIYTQLSSYYAWIRNTAGPQTTPPPAY